MAVPTVTTITPNHGPAGGGNFIEIVGTNFRLATPPPSGYVGGISSQETVRVLIGGFAASSVQPWSSTVLGVEPPAYFADADLAVFPPVNVRVQNIDGNGVVIPGEDVLVVEAYTYEREPLRMPTMGIESPFARVTRALLRLIKRQVVSPSGIQTHTDYSQDGIALLTAAVPSLFLTNMRVVPDSYGCENEGYWATQQDGSALYWPAPTMHTVMYDVLGASDFELEYMALMGAARKLVRRNGYLVMPADVPAGVDIRMPLAMPDEPSAGAGDRNSNLNVFLASIEVRRVPVVYLPPSLRTWPVETMHQEVQKTQGTLVETISMW
jgi:hypothetical protein